MDEPVGPPEPATVEWWRRPFRMYQTNLRLPDALMDVDAALDTIGSLGANAWLVNAGGIYSFYPTDLDFQTRNPYLDQRPSGDLFGDAVTTARARGVRVLARMDFSKVAEGIGDAHPDWCMVDPRGERQLAHGLYSVCPQGEYYQERAFDAISEVCRRYGPDGFFFNWFSFSEMDYHYRYRGVCHCERCVRAFETYAPGVPLPHGPEDASYPTWARYAADVLNALTARFRSHVAKEAPGAGLILGQAADIMFHEANNAVGRELWAVATSEAVSSFKSRRPEVPVLVNAAIFLDMPYRLSGEEPDHFASYLVQAIARGANPSIYSMGAPGDIKYPAYELAGEVTRFHRDNQALYEGLRPAGRVLLAQPSRRWQGASELARSTSEFRGFYSALLESHHPVEVMPAPDLVAACADGALDRFSVLVLPDVGPLPDGLPAALDEWVRRGGHLVTTGRSALGDDGTPQLAAAPGVRLTELIDDREALKNTFVGLLHGDAEVGVSQPSQMAPVIGEYARYDWHGDAVRHERRVAPAPIGPPELTYLFTATDDPGWALRSDGAGRVTSVPWPIGHAYHETSLSLVREKLLAVVDPPTDGLVIDLPEQCEVVAGRSGDSTVLHVVNLSGQRRRGLGPHLPLAGGSVTVAGRVRARALVAGVDVPVTYLDGRSTLQVPEVGRFEVLVLDDDSDWKERDE